MQPDIWIMAMLAFIVGLGVLGIAALIAFSIEVIAQWRQDRKLRRRLQRFEPSPAKDKAA